MNLPKKQHFVPQLYLRKFSCSEKSSNQIYAYRKTNKKIFKTNVKDIATEKDFYTIENLVDPYSWEKAYSKNVEPFMKNTLVRLYKKCESILVQDYSAVLTDQDKLDLSVCIIFQHLRGKYARDLEEFYGNEAKNNIIIEDEVLHPNDIERQKRIIVALSNYDYQKMAMMNVTFDDQRINKYVSLISKRSFTIYKILGKSQFVTSDSPVLFLNSLTLDSSPFKNGILQPTTVICFPLSPKLLLTAYHPGFLFGHLSEFDRCIIYLDDEREKSFISTMNNKQKENCYYSAFSNEECALM